MDNSRNRCGIPDRRTLAMRGGDATALLARMPDRFSHVVCDWATIEPSRIALIAGTRRLSYGELWIAARKATDTLQELGVRAGDRVLLVAENGLQIVPLLLAVSELDAWAVPLNARMSVREVQTIRAFSDCRRALYCIGDSSSAAEHAATDAFYNSSPIGHAIGLGTVLMTAFWAGASAELVARFTSAHFVEALKAERITAVTAVPTLFARILEYAEAKGISLRSRRLRIIATAGAPLDLALKARVEEAFGLRMGNSYGMTECNPVARSAGGVETNEVGELQPGVEIRIVAEDGGDVGAEESGEIWARGPTCMLGYYRNEAATAAAMREGNWLATGDLARMDDQGRLFIVGRSKDLIIRSGFNVYPVEVESVISLFPGVASVAVVGRDVPGNEEVVAFVQPLPGQVLDVDALLQWANQRLAPYKRPTAIIIKSELPIGPTGKILKIRLKQLAAAGGSDPR